jgi:hypothetical protein
LPSEPIAAGGKSGQAEVSSPEGLYDDCMSATIPA